MHRALVPLLALGVATTAGCASDDALQPPATATTSARYTCDDGRGFDIRFTHETTQVMTLNRTAPVTRESATLLLDGTTANLMGQPVGSGMHYAGDGYDFRGKGEEATLTSPDGTVRTCRAIP